MRLSVLSVAYPFAPVKDSTPGGAEQVLRMIDAALVRAGHRSIVIASADSVTEGILIGGPVTGGRMDEETRAEVRRHCRRLIGEAVRRWEIDLVHMHGLDFIEYLPGPGLPVLATLHLPVSWYSDKSLRPGRPGTYLHCVSSSQMRSAPPDIRLLPEIGNGVPVEALSGRISKRGYALALGRICPEKGFHLALDAARRADMPMLLAGEVFPYDEHRAYFREEILPRLDGKRYRFIGPVGPDRKRRLLAAAECVLVPSLVPETSSLTAMEALACGSPVIAFPAGALEEIVEHGKTGFLTDDWIEMSAAISAARLINPEDCRRTALEKFSSAQMVDKYLSTYRRILDHDKQGPDLVE